MWQNLIPACFGTDDLIFGGHHLDRERAIEMICAALRADANMDEIVNEVENYLEGNERNPTPEHIRIQLDRVRNLDF